MRLTQQLFCDSVVYFVSTGTPKSIFRSRHHYQGFCCFFSHLRIENKLREGICHFLSYNIILHISHSSTLIHTKFIMDVYLFMPYNQNKFCKQYNLERFELRSINENCHTFCRLQFVCTKLVSMIERYLNI